MLKLYDNGTSGFTIEFEPYQLAHGDCDREVALGSGSESGSPQIVTPIYDMTGRTTGEACATFKSRENVTDEFGESFLNSNTYCVSLTLYILCFASRTRPEVIYT